jgi:hypothetical protein
MPQSAFDFTVPLPFSGKTQTSRHCSQQAAVSASRTRAVKAMRYLAWLDQVEKATDAGAAEHFGWPISSVCSIRNGLFDRGCIAVYGVTKSRFNKSVTLWMVSDIGRRVVLEQKF